MYFNKFSKLNTTHFSGEALLLHVTNLLVDVVPLLPLVRLKNISLKINCELEVGQRLPTHHLSSTSVPAPNEFISFFYDEVIIIHPCCKYHQRRFKTIPICIPDICHFFTQAKFLENKIYTEKTRKLRQNTQ